MDFVRKVLNARVYQVAKETAASFCPALSERVGARVFIKREDLQVTKGFNVRGAYHAIERRRRRRADSVLHVVAPSSGRHAEGVAYAARHTGVSATIVIPSSTSQRKIDEIRRCYYGERPRDDGALRIARANGHSFEDAAKRAEEIAREESGGQLIHPFDDADVIAGQATVAAEIIRQVGALEDPAARLDAVYCPTGGGGLLAGVARYVKSVRPDVNVYGVETADAAPLKASLDVGLRVKLATTGNWLYPCGQPSRVGRLNFETLREHLDDVVTVDTDEVCAAIKDIFDETGTLLDPAGAAAVAGLKQRESRRNEASPDRVVVAVCSGSGVDFNRLRFVAERADDSEAFLAVTIPERPGAFRELYERIYPRNVTEFAYRRRGAPDDDDARVFVSFQPRSDADEDSKSVQSTLVEAGYDVVDLQDNELAKTHVRHLAGGRGGGGLVERVFRFEFPERPGALRLFLENLAEPVHLDFHVVESFDVSLFHYRSHGDDVGRVLAGFLVDESVSDHFEAFLDRLGYARTEETDNVVYRYFLK